MDSLKQNTIADGAGWLYRAAFHMAQGEKELAIEMYIKAKERIGTKELVHLSKYFNTIEKVKKKKDLKIIAERILEEYQERMFRLLS